MTTFLALKQLAIWFTKFSKQFFQQIHLWQDNVFQKVCMYYWSQISPKINYISQNCVLKQPLLQCFKCTQSSRPLLCGRFVVQNFWLSSIITSITYFKSSTPQWDITGGGGGGTRILRALSPPVLTHWKQLWWQRQVFTLLASVGNIDCHWRIRYPLG